MEVPGSLWAPSSFHSKLPFKSQCSSVKAMDPKNAYKADPRQFFSRRSLCFCAAHLSCCCCHTVPFLVEKS